MTLSIGIDLGHNCPPDTGAVGVKREDSLLMEVGKLTFELLEAQGVKVVNCKPSQVSSVRESLKTRCDIANKSNVSLFCSLHFNAFNGIANGSEVYAISPVGRSVAGCVLKELVSLGFANRGVKDGSHIFVVRNTQMPAILVEFAFCDSAKDMAIYDPLKAAKALVNGLMDGVKNKSKNVNTFMPEAFDISFPILRLNHGYGELVARLQAYFGLEPDGFFDSNLELKVKRKQCDLGIKEDGCVDEELWNLIFDVR